MESRAGAAERLIGSLLAFPDVASGRVDISVASILAGNVGEAVVERLSMSQSLGLDNHLACLVDITPLATDLNGRESLGELKGEVKLSLDDELPRPIDETVLFPELPSGKVLAKVSPYSRAVFFI